MELGARGSPVALLDQLLEEINFQRTKEMRQLFKDEGGFVVLQGTTQWTDLFVRHFLFAEEAAQAIDCDDLLFFVRKRHVSSSCRAAPKYETAVEVFRKDSKKLPIGDPEIEWEETVYLNLIVHQFEYTLTLAVCTRTSPKQLQVLRRHCTKVYASPSRRRMDSKGDGEEITYPHICFCVDNFDEVFSDMVVRDGEMVCVELLARGRGRGARAGGALFLGSVRYDALATVYDCRQSSLSSRMAQRMSFGLLGRAARCELLRMRGPHGKGHAEVAVWRDRTAAGSAADTPASSPGLSCQDLWDRDPGPDDEEMMGAYTYTHQRRLSDPSATLAAYSRSRPAAPPGRAAPGARSRSQHDGLDALASDPQQPEVDAGDVRDARRRSVSGSACAECCLGDSRGARGNGGNKGSGGNGGHTMREVYAPRDRAASYGSPTCLLRRDVRGREEAPAQAQYRLPHHIPPMRTDGKLPKLVKPKTNINQTKDKISGSPIKQKSKALSCDSPPRVTPTPRPSRSCSWLPSLGRLPHPSHRPPPPSPPTKTTPDGTTVYYWCDLPKRKHELDDGAYNPVWRARGFGQAFALWKEGRRAQSQPLTAALTYLTLPWWAIAKDILDVREEPILTF